MYRSNMESTLALLLRSGKLYKPCDCGWCDGADGTCINPGCSVCGGKSLIPLEAGEIARLATALRLPLAQRALGTPDEGTDIEKRAAEGK